MKIGLTSNADKASSALREIAQQFPREYRKALTTVGQRNKKRVISSIQNKRPKEFPSWKKHSKLSDVTFKLRARRGNNEREMGGKLSQVIRYKKRGDRVFVGAIDTAQRAFERFQTAQEKDLNPKERQLRHKMGIEDMDYKRPARPVIKPLADWPGMMADMVHTIKRRWEDAAKRAAKKARAVQ